MTIENRILLGLPDVLIIAVGGGDKVYNGIEAASIVRSLNPRIVILVKYRKQGSNLNCDQQNIDLFLKEMQGTQIRNVGRKYWLPNLHEMPEEMTIFLMN